MKGSSQAMAAAEAAQDAVSSLICLSNSVSSNDFSKLQPPEAEAEAMAEAPQPVDQTASGAATNSSSAENMKEAPPSGDVSMALDGDGQTATATATQSQKDTRPEGEAMDEPATKNAAARITPAPMPLLQSTAPSDIIAAKKAALAKDSFRRSQSLLDLSTLAALVSTYSFQKNGNQVASTASESETNSSAADADADADADSHNENSGGNGDNKNIKKRINAADGLPVLIDWTTAKAAVQGARARKLSVSFGHGLERTAAGRTDASTDGSGSDDSVTGHTHTGSACVRRSYSLSDLHRVSSTGMPAGQEPPSASAFTRRPNIMALTRV